jgi:hypothetical protein
MPMATFWGITDSILRWPKSSGADVPALSTSLAATQLNALLEEAAAVTRAGWDLIADRTPAELTQSAQPGAWSVAQCFAHLAQTTQAFLPPISQAIGRAPRLWRDRGLRTGALAKLFIRNMEPPYRLRYKVVAGLVPLETDFLSAWQAFEDSQTQLAEVIESARSLAIDKVEISSPVYARFRYNVYGALRMLTAHQRRHLWQVERTLKGADRNTPS